MKGYQKDKIFKIVKFLFPLLLLIFAIFEIKKFVGNLDVHMLENELNQLNFLTLLLIIGVTFSAVLPMLLYDVILVRILGAKVPKKELLEQSFIANSFSNLIGFGGLIGAALRTYFFHKLEQDKRRLLSVIATVSLFYLAGISLLSWAAALWFRKFPLFVDTKWLYFAVLGVALYLPVFLIIHRMNAKKGKQSLIKVKEGTKLIGVSFVEWIAVFFAIYLLTRILGIPIRIEDLFPVYIAAVCAGIISMIPGGLGSFDLVFIWGMQEFHMAEEKVLVLLLLYRVGYYLLPFIVSLIFFVKLYWERWNQSWNNLPNAILEVFSHVILTMLVFLSGLILLLSASVPGIMSRLKIAQELLSFPIINVSHQLSVAAGFLLLGLSRGIEYRVKRTYELTMAALILAALFSIFKGIDYEEAIFLIIVAILLRVSKGQFYRESYVLTWGRTIFDIALIVIITSMYIIIGYLNLPDAKLALPAKLLPYVIIDYHDLFMSAGIGLFIAVSILAIGYLNSLSKKWKFESSLTQEQEILQHLHKYQGKVLSHLIFLHDKYIFWNKKRNVMISFQKYADKLVILGDPIGELNDLSSAIEEFQEIADLHGFSLVFYQVSEEMLPYLYNHGFAFFKLGEEAFVKLREFSLAGSKMKGLRAIKNKFTSENFRYELVNPPHSSELLKELREVSNDWLQGSKEKGYSLGFFDEAYLNKAPIALVKDSNSRIIGFMSMMYVYDDNQTISVDLMRFRPDVESGSVDFLFLSLMDWAKEQGYRRFNMGMAPLANVGLSKFSFLSEKIAAQIFLHGHFFYHFQGLRKFKEKYTNIWEPKYLAYRKKSSLPFIMAQITLLISKRRA
ncbi:bifunctional lysylphosphatidylglycerol flippase/synthetase MprF [Neobacillus sp. 114]|uniref:bifunctional lysylphosphatidylglycerol flippase/synthetase MprF n=1 Tax=Neobacillus sp. 114 TaxID=3048535 RepID=UPI001C24A015|nr:bifunctional lysylphosphatidylglycerol flippase/synthetase MprF [Neobacillus sp. 114]MBU8919960.1 bifunctional lysylphosphatidylglycerol flippase/synthetase MprF [Bacillus sp. FJAT-29953]